jgi:hypothetical protein
MYYDTLSSNKLFIKKPHQYPNVVVEFKTNIKQKDHLCHLLKKTSLTPVRHSKYLSGLAILGYIVYL